MALGASTFQAMRSVVLPGLALASIGAAAGIVASVGAAHVLRHMIWGISTSDPGTFAGTAASLLLVAAASCVIPALRITRLNPAETLRNE
jgi:putative ABC transport system permease protein